MRELKRDYPSNEYAEDEGTGENKKTKEDNNITK